MEFVRHSLKFVIGALFFLSLLAMNFFLTFYLSLDYSNLDTQVSPDSYNTNYECSFFDCFEKGYPPQFILSQHSRDYWGKLFYFSILLTLVSGIVMYLVVEKKTMMFLIVGGSLIAISLPYVKAHIIFLIFSSFFNMDSVVGEGITQIIWTMFSESWNVFLIYFIPGVILTAIGFGLKFFDFEERIRKKIRNFWG